MNWYNFNYETICTKDRSERIGHFNNNVIFKIIPILVKCRQLVTHNKKHENPNQQQML